MPIRPGFCSCGSAIWVWLLGIGKDLLIRPTRKKLPFPPVQGCTNFAWGEWVSPTPLLAFNAWWRLVLRGLHWSICLIYLHYIIVYSEKFSHHLQHLKEVFEHFRTAGLKLKSSKCHLAQSSVMLLGHRFSSSGVEPDPANTEKVSTLPVPQSDTQVRAVLGLCSYYRPSFRTLHTLQIPYTSFHTKGCHLFGQLKLKKLSGH